MKCTCCGEEADSVLETLASGVSFLCEECGELLFLSIISQGRNEYECTSGN